MMTLDATSIIERAAEWAQNDDGPIIGFVCTQLGMELGRGVWRTDLPWIGGKVTQVQRCQRLAYGKGKQLNLAATRRGLCRDIVNSDTTVHTQYRYSSDTLAVHAYIV